MRGRGWFQQTRIGRATKRFLVGTALVAQCFALVAPLGDAHQAPIPTLSQLLTSGGTASFDAPAPNPEHHNPATCVACIAQTLVALRSSTPIATPVIGATRELHETFRTTPRSTDPGAHYRPRGPPNSL